MSLSTPPSTAAARNTGTPTIPLGSPLLMLGRRHDADTERGVLCPGDLPAPDDPSLTERARAAREKLGDQVVVLGHHYQRDQVIEFADLQGDSFELSRQAAQVDAPYIVFCGVHFMAESASILGRHEQKVILPDLAAGCSMADMAEARQLEDAWRRLERAGVADDTVPLTYMNSSADIKAFCGERGGATCTSSNAPQAMQWAFEQAASTPSAGKVLFLPDQHLGRNTAVLSLGLSLEDCVVYDPWQPDGGLTDEELRAATVILWKGHCSVHARFSPEMIDKVRAEIDDVEILVHPECRHEVVLAADRVGSTSQILRWIHEAPAGSAFAVATELNLVKRLDATNPDKQVVFLDDTVCFCATMNRIDLPHLVWALESLVDGEVVNEVKVAPHVRENALLALKRMLSLPGTGKSLAAANA